MADMEVRFDIYCPTCTHYSEPEEADPCWDCLENPCNEDSRKPTRWEEKDGYSRRNKTCR